MLMLVTLVLISKTTTCLSCWINLVPVDPLIESKNLVFCCCLRCCRGVHKKIPPTQTKRKNKKNDDDNNTYVWRMKEKMTTI